MQDVIRLSDQQYDYLKKLVINDLQRVIADKAYDATLNRADVLLNLIKMHALARRPANRNSMTVQATKQPDPVFIEEDEPVESFVESEPTRTEVVPGKVCKKCGKEKPLDEFPKNKHMKDGRGSLCKSCTALYQQERYNKRKGKA